MCTLEKLIAQLCPDGVEYKPLGELGEFYSGLSGKSKDDFVDGNARFISYMNVFSNLSTRTDIEDRVMVSDSEKQNVVEYGDVLFTGASETKEECGMASVMTHHPCEKIYLNSFCFGFRLKDKQVFEPDFMKHLSRSFNIRKQISNTASGVTRFNVSKVRMAKVCLPIPPLPVQKEIVRMLDEMTGLIDALEEELAARKNQYEWCRERLLRMEDGVEYKPLGEVLKYEQPTKYIVHSTEYDDSFATPVLTAGQSFILGYTDEEDNHYQASKASPVIIFDDFTTATQWVDFEFKVKSSAMKILSLKEDVVADIRFVYFAIQCIGFKPGEHARHWIEKYSRFEIPLPPLPVQKEIVRMLDGMTGLIDTLEEELALRKQQYEYYRDTLLAFKRKPEVA